MTLYDYMTAHPDEDFDSGDAYFDATVTVCYEVDEDADFYNKVTIGLLRFVDVVTSPEGVPQINAFRGPVCEWTEMIKRNEGVFRKYAKKEWNIVPKDIDDFAYEMLDYIDKAIYGGGLAEPDYEEFFKQVMPKLIPGPGCKVPISLSSQEIETVIRLAEANLSWHTTTVVKSGNIDKIPEAFERYNKDVKSDIELLRTIGEHNLADKWQGIWDKAIAKPEEPDHSL